MSVLIEAFSLVVPRRLLYLGFVGGIEAFEIELSRPSAENRSVCADAHLISVSFFTPEAAGRMASTLTSAGLVESKKGAYLDFAILDQHSGPLLECHWLDWTLEPEGHTCAWLADAGKGELAAPLGWNPTRSRRLTPPGATPAVDAMLLSDEKGVETWLDLRTGRIASREKSRGT